ncbi:MAG TPA: sigma 54-interacting transcriptional regulator [Kofleriaceae bacterium]
MSTGAARAEIPRMEFLTERHTPTVPTDRHAALAALRRDRVIAIRIYGSGRELELPSSEAERFVIGAAATCDLALDDPYISAVHCELERRPPDRLLVRDRRSKNGTFLNGNRVEVAELPIGAVLTVGRTGLLALGRRTRQQPSARELMVGQDPALRAALDQATVAAGTTCNVLVVGETGTGKELVARAIHEASARALGPFVAVNCGAIPADLAGSELFGHERGAFTGAMNERDGYFVQADGGTLFLDELGELPRTQQPHLLRVLESRRVRRVGGHRERAVDIRLVSATNRLDLERETSPLRTDLYHRVATLVIELPPLRERPGDIPLLVEAFLAELEPEFGRREVAPGALEALADHPWPGNVRELRHAVHRAAALSANRLRLEDLLPRRTAVPVALPPEPVAAIPLAAGDLPPFEVALRDLLQAAYRQHRSVRRAAAALGIPKSTFADRARRFGIL